MANILSEEEYLRQYHVLWNRFFSFFQENLENERFQKMEKIFQKLQTAYSRHRFFTVRQMRSIEKYQLTFQGEQRILMKDMVELLKKLLWQKKLTREGYNT